jgi:GntR family transcriptional regulator
MVIAAGHRRPAATRERIEQLRPALERAAAAARELAIPKAQVLQLLERLLDASDTGTEP